MPRVKSEPAQRTRNKEKKNQEGRKNKIPR